MAIEFGVFIWFRYIIKRFFDRKLWVRMCFKLKNCFLGLGSKPKFKPGIILYSKTPVSLVKYEY
jgi:hypothetical protein